MRVTPPASGRAGGDAVAARRDPARVGRALARLSRLLEQASSAAGLSLAQYRVLVLVAERPQRASALAAKVDVQRATLSAIVGGLERAGLLRRVPVAHDGRGVQLRLTPAGRRRLDEAEATLTAQLLSVGEAGGAELSVLADQLEQMIAGFELIWVPPVPEAQRAGAVPRVRRAGEASRRPARVAGAP